MKAKLVKALRFGKQTVAPIEGKVTLVELDDDEFERLASMSKVARPTSDDLKIGHLIELRNSTTKAATTSSAAEPAKTEPDVKVKPFDKMTKAELEQALADSGFTAPENWADLKNGEKATWLQAESDKPKGTGGNGGGSDDLTI